MFLGNGNVSITIGHDSLQKFKIKCHSLILSTEKIKGNFRSFAMIPERIFVILSSFPELQDCIVFY